ncbi:hypothetical protein C0585_08410 [Candidatus Woesearchaeota archaeon]|nr:MAG: hypothetical protein C0585_08410 [Candidatus Woesearchaeota archaeon]
MELRGRPELVEDIALKYPRGYQKLIDDKRTHFIYSEDLELAARLAEECVNSESKVSFKDVISNLIEGKLDLAESLLNEYVDASKTKIPYSEFLHSLTTNKINYYDKLIGYQNFDWDAPIQKREDVIKEMNKDQELDLEEIVSNNDSKKSGRSIMIGGANIAAGLLTTSVSSLALHYSDSVDKVPFYTLGLMMGPALIGIGIGYLLNEYLENKFD